MPNWCGNTLSCPMTGDEMVEKKILIKENGDYYFNLHKLYPKYSYYSMNFLRYILEYIKIKTIGYKTVFKKTRTRIIDSYMGWLWDYDWCINNIGTKWYPDIHPDNTDMLYFDSAWSPPTGLVQKLSEVYGGTWVLEYEESGCDFEGTFEVCDGEIIFDETRDYIPTCEITGRKDETCSYREDAEMDMCESAYQDWLKNIKS